MNCHQFEADLVDLARGADLASPVEERLHGHLEECAGCAARFERERFLTTQLKTLAGSVPESPQAAAIERQLLQAFAERRAAVSRPAQASGSVFAMLAARPWLAAAVALIIATTVWLGSAPWWSTGEVQPDSTRAAIRPSESVPVSASATEGAITPAALAQAADTGPRMDAPQPRTSRNRDAGVGRARDEGVLRFVALPTAVGLPGLESGRIVRVELSTAMLPAYGFDLDPGTPSGVVEADLLVGQDGQPRAIRFVSVDSASRRRQ